MTDEAAESARATPATAGEAAKAVSEDVRRLVRAEVELAKAEIRGQVATRGVALALLAIAGLLGLSILYWLTFAVYAGWTESFSSWAAALLTAAVLAGGALLLGLIGGLILRQPMKPPLRAQAAAEKTQAMVKERLGR